MAGYWPSPDALKDDPVIAERMNSLNKLVFSKSVDSSDWSNTKIVKSNPVEEIARLKMSDGKDMAIFGSSDLSLTLIKHGMIDEYRIFINPVVLGNGKPLFKGISGHLKLKLIKSKTFNSGNVLLCYAPAASSAK